MSLILAIAGVLRSVRPLTLTGTLPATAKVGTAYSGTVTLAGDFTAPVTIDASAGTIPAWLVPTISGNTVTFAGTPDADGMLNFTPRATDAAAQVAVGAAQTIAVSAAGASSDVTILGVAANSNTIGSPPEPTQNTLHVEAGDDIWVVLAVTGNWYASYKSSCTDSAGNAYTLVTPDDSGANSTLAWHATAKATADITVSAVGRRYYGSQSVAVYRTSPATGTATQQSGTTGATTLLAASAMTPGHAYLIPYASTSSANTVNGATQDTVSGNYSTRVAHVVASAPPTAVTLAQTMDTSSKWTVVELVPSA